MTFDAMAFLFEDLFFTVYVKLCRWLFVTFVTHSVSAMMAMRSQERGWVRAVVSPAPPGSYNATPGGLEPATSMVRVRGGAVL
jgi:hypothetical protein